MKLKVYDKSVKRLNETWFIKLYNQGGNMVSLNDNQVYFNGRRVYTLYVPDDAIMNLYASNGKQIGYKQSNEFIEELLKVNLNQKLPSVKEQRELSEKTLRILNVSMDRVKTDAKVRKLYNKIVKTLDKKEIK